MKHAGSVYAYVKKARSVYLGCRGHYDGQM